jgi:hypothetical protein
MSVNTALCDVCFVCFNQTHNSCNRPNAYSDGTEHIAIQVSAASWCPSSRTAYCLAWRFVKDHIAHRLPACHSFALVNHFMPQLSITWTPGESWWTMPGDKRMDFLGFVLMPLLTTHPSHIIQRSQLSPDPV